MASHRGVPSPFEALLAEGQQLLDALPNQHFEAISAKLVDISARSDNALAACIQHRLSARPAPSLAMATVFDLQASSPPLSERSRSRRPVACHTLTSTDTCNTFWSMSRVWSELQELESALGLSGLSGEHSLSSSPREWNDVDNAASDAAKSHASSVMHGLNGVKEALRDHCSAGLQLRALIEATRFSAERRAGRYAQELKQMKRRLTGNCPVELEAQLAMCRGQHSALEHKVAYQERDLRAARAQEAMTTWKHALLQARHARDLLDNQRDWQSGTQLFVKELARNVASKSASFHAWLCVSRYRRHLRHAQHRMQTRRPSQQAAAASACCALFLLHLSRTIKDKRRLARHVRWLQKRRMHTCFGRWCDLLAARSNIILLARVHLALRRLRRSWTRWQMARGHVKTQARFLARASYSRALFLMARACGRWVHATMCCRLVSTRELQRERRRAACCVWAWAGVTADALAMRCLLLSKVCVCLFSSPLSHLSLVLPSLSLALARSRSRSS